MIQKPEKFQICFTTNVQLRIQSPLTISKSRNGLLILPGVTPVYNELTALLWASLRNDTVERHESIDIAVLTLLDSFD